MEFQLHHHSFQRNPRADLLQNGLAGSPCSPVDSQESSPTSQFKSISSSALSLLHIPSLTALALASNYNQTPLPSSVPTAVVSIGAGPRDPLRGDRDLTLPLPKTPGLQGTGQHTGHIGPLCLQDPSPRHRCPTPSARTSTSTCTCTCTCSGFGRRT